MKLLTLAVLAGASLSFGIGLYLIRGGWSFEVSLVSEEELRAACGMGVCGDVEEFL